MGRKKNVILPPQLPPDITEDEIVVSDEDLQFVKENPTFAGFLKRVDTQSINRHVSRVANKKEDVIEALYEKSVQKRSLEREKEKQKEVLRVDPVDALPIKNLDGTLVYRTTSSKKSKFAKDEPEEDESDEEDKDGEADKSVVKLTKPERRAKLKKSKKEAKKQMKEQISADDEEEVKVNPQAQVLEEVKQDLSAEEMVTEKKHKLAELGMSLLTDPESNIKSLKDILQLSKDEDHTIVKLGLLSLLAVFKDIIPGYRIRLPTEKEMEMNVSKAIKKMRFYESTLLTCYKAYLQKLIAIQKQTSFQHVAVRCMCSLLDAVPHFNFRENLLAAVVNNMTSSDDVIRKLCCSTIKSLFVNAGKHGGEATVEAVNLIANLVKFHDCQLHPDIVEVFLSLTFDEDIGKPDMSKGDKRVGKKEQKRMKNSEDPKKVQVNKGKRSRQELTTKTREEVDADLKAVSFAPDVLERKAMQTETLSAVFQTYFRILKHTTQTSPARSKLVTGSGSGGFGRYPLLAPCLNGLGKFSHLIDLDFMGDLMNSLKKLASGGSNNDSSPEYGLTVTERLRCCTVAFRVMRINLDALNVDLHEFFVQLYNLILEYRPDRDQGEVLAEALKTVLCEGRQHDMQRAAAFIKRLATFSLCFGSAEAMAALVTLRDLLQKNIKCRNLLENDAGGGSVSGSVAKYQPFASDPNQSGALASVLWELSLLSKHYHPKVAAAASGISNLSTDQNQVYLSTTTPQQALIDLSLEQETFNPKGNLLASNKKRKRLSGSSTLSDELIQDSPCSLDEDDIRKRLSEHFNVLRGITENERLRRDLNHTVSSIKLYEQYKKQKKNQEGSKTRKKR